MTAFLEEAQRFRSQQDSPVVLVNQPHQRLLFGRRQLLPLLFEIERFKLRPFTPAKEFRAAS